MIALNIIQLSFQFPFHFDTRIFLVFKLHYPVYHITRIFPDFKLYYPITICYFLSYHDSLISYNTHALNSTHALYNGTHALDCNTHALNNTHALSLLSYQF